MHSTTSHHHPPPTSPPPPRAMNRLMADREVRLSETRKKLSLWEDNLTLAQVDQDRVRKEVQARMVEVTTVKDQWEKARDTLKLERRQMDLLSKRLKERESAVSARERQSVFVEEELKLRQQKMEQIAIEMAVKKTKTEYAAKELVLEQRSTALAAKERATKKQLLQEKTRLHEQALHNQRQSTAQHLKFLENKATLDETTRLEKIQWNKKVKETKTMVKDTETKLALYATEYKAKRAEIKQAKQMLSTNNALLLDKEQQMAVREKLFQKESLVVREQLQTIETKEINVRNDKEQLKRDTDKLGQQQACMATKHTAHAQQVLAETQDLHARDALLVEKAAQWRQRQDQWDSRETNIREQELSAMVRGQKLEESQQTMSKERAELNALMLQLEERRKGLDVMDQHLQAFGEDCEYQREKNVLDSQQLLEEKNEFENTMMEERLDLDKEKIQLNMEVLELERENRTIITRTTKSVDRTAARPSKKKENVVPPAQGSATAAVRKKKNKKKKKL